MPVTPKIRSLSSEGSEDTRADYPIGRPIREPAFGDDRRRGREVSERSGILIAWRTWSAEHTRRCELGTGTTCASCCTRICTGQVLTVVRFGVESRSWPCWPNAIRCSGRRPSRFGTIKSIAGGSHPTESHHRVGIDPAVGGEPGGADDARAVAQLGRHHLGLQFQLGNELVRVFADAAAHHDQVRP
jgi:hypothetical protein